MARQVADEQATPAVPGAVAPAPLHADRRRGLQVVHRPEHPAEPATAAMPGAVGAAVVMASVALGAGLGLASAATLQAPAAADAALANLLHAMVGIKALIFAAAATLILMRLRAPAAAASLAGYGAGLGVSAAALVWLWGLSGLLVGSALFYGGLAIGYLTASRDPLLASALKGSPLRRG